MKMPVLPILFVLAMSLTPASLCAQGKETTSGQTIFSGNCAACHGSDGRGGERAPDIATTRSVVSLTDSDLEAIVTKGLPGVGMPPFGYIGAGKVRDVVAFLRVLQGKVKAEKLAGDSRAGRALFYGKAGCSKCHMVHGEGGFIAADLTTYGGSVSAAALRNIILNPNQNLQPTSKLVVVRTRKGQSISGLLRNEDNFSISLLSEDGRFHMFSKAKLASVVHTTHSLMPENYKSELSSDELENLISYLVTTAASNHNVAPLTHRSSGNDDD